MSTRSRPSLRSARPSALTSSRRSTATPQPTAFSNPCFTSRDSTRFRRTALVVGETAAIEDDVSILQEVTLGGTGKEAGDRHPKIRHGVLIGAGAKILGNIEIGHYARIAAGSVVLKSVPHNTTVAGVPAKVIGEARCPEPSRAMDHLFDDDDG